MSLKSKVTRAMAKVGGSPTPSTDGFFLFDNVDVVTIDTAQVNISPLRGSFTKVPSLIGRQLYRFAGKVFCDQKPSGTAVAPKYDPLLRCCGLSLNTGATSLEYTPIATGFSNSDIHVDYNGLLYPIDNAIGTFTMSGSAGQGVEINLDLTGLYAAPVATPASWSSWSGGSSVIETAKSCTISITPVGGAAFTAAIWKSFSFTRGADIQEITDMQAADALYAIDIADATPTLEVVIEAPDTLATNLGDYFDALRASTLHNVQLKWGTNKSGIWALSAGKCQLTSIAMPDGDAGRRNLTLQYALTHTTDNAEFAIKVDKTGY